jgi:PP-loop superfamily ATP-utilizing enzyme
VRHHGEIARIEVALDEIDRLREIAPQVSGALRALGFRDVTVDPRGLRPGGMAGTARRDLGEAAAEPDLRPPQEPRR